MTDSYVAICLLRDEPCLEDCPWLYDEDKRSGDTICEFALPLNDKESEYENH